MGSSPADTWLPSLSRPQRCPGRGPARLTCEVVALGPTAVFLDKDGGGQEESPAHHGDEAAEQQRQLQRAELPEEGVAPPQGVRHLQKHSAGLQRHRGGRGGGSG